MVLLDINDYCVINKEIHAKYHSDLSIRMQQLYGLDSDQVAASCETLLDKGQGKLADAVIVATQDKVGYPPHLYGA